MVSYAQLLNMDTSKLTSAADAATGLSSTLSTRGTDVQSVADIPAAIWAGADADAARNVLKPLPSPLFDVSDATKAAGKVLTSLVEAVTAGQEKLKDAQNLATSGGLTIGPDGTVTTPIVSNAATAADNDERARQVRQLIDEALKNVTDADDETVDQLSEDASALDNIFKILGMGSEGLERAIKTFGSPASAEYFEAANKGIGRAGNIMGIVTAALEQAAKDWNDPNLTPAEKAARIGYRGLVEGGLGAVGGTVGGLVGAYGGSTVGGGLGLLSANPYGVIGGAFLGGAVGAIGGNYFGGEFAGDLGGDFVDSTIDSVGRWFR